MIQRDSSQQERLLWDYTVKLVKQIRDIDEVDINFSTASYIAWASATQRTEFKDLIMIKTWDLQYSFAVIKVWKPIYHRRNCLSVCNTAHKIKDNNHDKKVKFTVSIGSIVIKVRKIYLSLHTLLSGCNTGPTESRI